MKNKVYMYASPYGWYQLNNDAGGPWWGIWFHGPKPYKEGLKNFVRLPNDEVAVQITLGLLPPTFSGGVILWPPRKGFRYVGKRADFPTGSVTCAIADSNVRIYVEK